MIWLQQNNTRVYGTPSWKRNLRDTLFQYRQEGLRNAPQNHIRYIPASRIHLQIEGVKSKKTQPDIVFTSFSLPPDTIFAFLTLNTTHSAHLEISDSKFASFKRAVIEYWNTANYAIKKRNVQWIAELNKHYRVAIEPLYHSNTASFVIQKSLFYLPTVAVLEWERGFSYVL